ncbi:acyl-CoA dehydrogenase [Actinomadura craniellae]|uniref:Acyl-CoA dehydrogenase n=1 Tax=Actinomadura craniellae TaxID=2231787 RepID=A0A365HAV0_9ACTN|nr:acyl-CoA dehydrogenase [Actinomadura craniellae]RAY16274.1 acyl-CoA dehydrogenase [Actinomadura craniellae]
MSEPTDFGVPPLRELEVSGEQARRLAAVLDDPAGPELAPGRPLPALWHWALGTPETSTTMLGPDGHPRLPSCGPAAGFPRRMWAGGRVEVHRPLLIGAPALRETSVLRAERKTGRSGRLLVVTLRHVYTQHDATAIEEEQDLVYREPGAPVPAPEGGHSEPAPPGGWAERAEAGPVMLFRFSAVTFNAHRIHYDAAYARDVEGYPGLVVQGPLTALLLAESARRRTGREIAGFSFRASAPLFADAPFTLTGRPAEPDVELRAVRGDGQVATAATARLAG